MKVILTENIGNLGAIGDVVNVANGYARNFLLPTKKALVANENNINILDHNKLLVEHRKKKLMKDAKALADKIEKLSITIPRKVGEGEKLYGSVTSMDIEKALVAEGLDIPRGEIVVDEPIKKLGIYNIPINVGPATTAKLKVWVVEE